MKQSGRLLTLAAFALGSAFLVSSVQAEIGKAVVRTVKGSADFMQGAGWKALRTGTVLKPGAVVRTGSESQVDLFLDQNGPVVRITENTELALDRLDFEQTGADTVIETQFDLKSGRILGHVKPMAAASRYEVKTPMGVAAIKGTDYDISASGLVRVPDGKLVFTYAGPNQQRLSQVVNTGEQFSPTMARPIPIEQALLNELLKIIDELRTVGGIPGMVVIVPPSEPPVSATTGSTQESGHSGSTEGSGHQGN